jgi:hypothetical protein
MKRSVLLVVVAVLAMLVATAGVSSASSPYQLPLTALSKVCALEDTFAPVADGGIPCTVTFTFSAPATNVVIEDNFLHGLNYVPGTAVFSGGAVSVTHTASSLDRQTWEFLLAGGGTIPAGTYTLTFREEIETVYPANNPYVKDTLNLYVNGAWKGKASNTLPVLLDMVE